MLRLGVDSSSNMTTTATSLDVAVLGPFVTFDECEDILSECEQNLALLYEDIDTINDRQTSVLIPVMVAFGFIAVFGTIGNSLILYLFGWKLPKNNQSYLIVQLAVIDLIRYVHTTF